MSTSSNPNLIPIEIQSKTFIIEVKRHPGDRRVRSLIGEMNTIANNWSQSNHRRPYPEDKCPALIAERFRGCTILEEAMA